MNIIKFKQRFLNYLKRITREATRLAGVKHDKEYYQKNAEKYKEFKEAGFEKFDSLIMEEEQGGEIPPTKKFLVWTSLSYVILATFSLVALFYRNDYSNHWFLLALPFFTVFISRLLIWHFGKEGIATQMRYLMAIFIVSFLLIYDYEKFTVSGDLNLLLSAWILPVSLIFVGAVSAASLVESSKSIPINPQGWKKSFLEMDEDISSNWEGISEIFENTPVLWNLDKIKINISENNLKGIYSMGKTHRILFLSEKNGLSLMCFERLGKFIVQNKRCLEIEKEIQFALKKALNFNENNIPQDVDNLNELSNAYMLKYLGTKDLFGEIKQRKEPLIGIGIPIIFILFIFGVNELPEPKYGTVKTILFGVAGGALVLTLPDLIKKHILKD